MNVTLNKNEKLFVISTGNSVSCLGFDVVYQQALELCRRLKAHARYILSDSPIFSLKEEEKGTLVQYEQHNALLAEYNQLGDTHTWFDARTPDIVQKVLETARKSQETMRIFCGDVTTGRDWMDEYDTIGRIGRSIGAMKSPLLIPKDDVGGPAILTHCIVRIVNVATGKEVYRHPTYHTPKMAVVNAASYDVIAGHTHSVTVENIDGVPEMYANFKSYEKAAHWVAFMAGYCHSYSSAA